VGYLFCEASEGEQWRPAEKVGQLPGNKNKVAHAVVYAKTTVELDDNAFIHDDTPECQVLWEMATESVFKLADKLDDSDNKK
jgi:hypothetical protein